MTALNAASDSDFAQTSILNTSRREQDTALSLTKMNRFANQSSSTQSDPAGCRWQSWIRQEQEGCPVRERPSEGRVCRIVAEQPSTGRQPNQLAAQLLTRLQAETSIPQRADLAETRTIHLHGAQMHSSTLTAAVEMQENRGKGSPQFDNQAFVEAEKWLFGAASGKGIVPDADTTQAFSNWAMGDQEAQADADLGRIRLLRDQCPPPPCPPVAEKVPLLLEAPAGELVSTRLPMPVLQHQYIQRGFSIHADCNRIIQHDVLPSLSRNQACNVL